MSLIVLVDDEEALCRALGRVLALTGADVRTFSDPGAALRFLDTNAPNLVICDYRMPKLNGLEMLARLPAGVPFALLTGDLAAVDANDPRLTAVLQKPVRSEELLRFARSFLGGAAQPAAPTLGE